MRQPSLYIPTPHTLPLGWLLLLCAWLLPLFGHAAVYTWTNQVTTAGALGAWTNVANWNPNTAPASAITTTNVYFTNIVVSTNAALNTTNGIGAPFFLNALTLGGAGPAASSTRNATINIYGGGATYGLSFTNNGSVSPTLNLLATKGPSNITYNIYAPIDINTNVLTINGDSNGTFNVFSTISGSGSLLKYGASTITLGGTNTYTGNTIITNGSVIITNNSSLGTAGTVSMTNKAVQLLLGLSGMNVTRPLILNAGVGFSGFGALQYNLTSGTATWSGPVSITGTTVAGGHFGTGGVGAELNISGAITSSVQVVSRIGTVRFSSTANNFSSVGVTQDILKLGADNALPIGSTLGIGASAGSAFDMSGFNQELAGLTRSGAFGATNMNASATMRTLTLTIPAGSNNIFAGYITTNLALIKKGPGILTLTGTNTINGGITVNAGTLLINGSGSVTGAVTVASGAVLGGNSVITNGSVTVQTGGSVSPGDVNAVGTLIITNANTAGVTLNNGTCLSMDLANTATLGGGINDLLVVNGNLAMSGTIAVNVGFINGAPVLNQPYSLIRYSGTLSGGGCTFVMTNSHYSVSFGTNANAITMTFTAVGNNNVVWQGDPISNTNWAAGVLGVTNMAGVGALDFFFNGDNILFNDTATNFIVNVSGPVTPSTITNVANNNYTFTGAGSITGGALAQNGGGTLNLNLANNTYAGGTIINAGVLKLNLLGVSNAIPSGVGKGVVTINAGGRLELGGVTNTIINALNGSGVVSNGTSAGTLALTLGTSGDNGSFSGGITNTVGYMQLVKIGAGTQVLAGPSAFGAATNANSVTNFSGILQLGHSQALGSNGNNVAVAGGILDINGTSPSLGWLQGLAAGTVTNSAVTTSTLTLVGRGQSTSPTIRGNLNLVLTAPAFGSSWQTLNNSNDFTGFIQVNGGLLSFWNTNAFVNVSAITNSVAGGGLEWKAAGNAGVGVFPSKQLTLNNGAFVTMNSQANCVTNYTWLGPITLGSGSCAFTGAGGAPYTNNLMGPIDGAGSLVINMGVAAGVTRLYGTNIYTGNTTVNGGGLALGANGSISNSPTITVNNNTNVFDVSAVSGGFTLNGAIGQTLAGSGLVAGNVTVANGAVLVPGTAGTVNTLIFTNGNLTFNTGGKLVMDLGATTNVGGTVNDLVVVNGNILLNGTVYVAPNFFSGPPALNQPYTLVQFTGAVTGSGGNWALVNANYDAVFTTNSGTLSSITVTFTSAGNNGVVWQGDPNNNTNWTSGTLGVTNLAGSGALDYFYNGDRIMFDDTAPNVIVNLPGSVAPATIANTASANNFLIIGAGKITGSTGLGKDGAATLTLATANDYSGNTLIASGTLQLGNGGASGSVAGFITNNAQLNIVRSNTVTVANPISGSGVVANLGTGKTILTATNTYTGFTTNAPGSTLQGSSFSLPANIANDGTLIISQSTTNPIAGSIVGAGSLTVAGATGGGGAVLTNANGIAGFTTVSNYGTLVLGGTTGYTLTNTLVIGEGFTQAVVQIGASAQQMAPGNTVIFNSGPTGGKSAKFQLNGFTNIVGAITNATPASGQGVIENGSASAARITVSNVVDSFWSGYLRNLAGTLGLTKDGTAALILSGANITHTGPSFVQNGSLVLTNTTALVNDVTVTGGQVVLQSGTAGQSLSLTNLQNGGLTFSSLSPTNAYTLGMLAGTGDVGLTNELGNSATLIVGNRAVVGVYSGGLSGTGGLTKIGTGSTLILAGTNTYTGATLINDNGGALILSNANGPAVVGGVQIGNNGAGGGSSFLKLGADEQIPDDATVTFAMPPSTSAFARFVLMGHNETVGGLSATLGTNAVIGVAENGDYVTNSSGVLLASTLTVKNNADNYYGGYLRNNFGAGSSSGPLALVKDGTGTLTLGKWHLDHSGGTTVKAGRLVLTNGFTTGANPLSVTTASLLVNGPTAVFDLTTNSQQLGTVTLGDGVLTNGSLTATAFLVTNGDIYTSLGGAAALNKSGDGLVTLHVTNSYTGNTLINGGTLRLAATGSISNIATISPAAGATLDASPAGGLLIKPGQTLGGSGNVTGVVGVDNGAAIAPGDVGTVGTLTLSGGLAVTNGNLKFDLSDQTATGNDLLVMNGLLDLAGMNTVQVNLLSGGLAAGDYTLISGITAVNSGWINNLQFGGLTRQTIGFHFEEGTPGSSITNLLMNVGGSGASLVWLGTNGTAWDVNTTTNWWNAGDLVADAFFNFDNVLINDTATNADGSINGLLVLNTNVSPASLVVSNTATNFVISGSGGIFGTTGLSKQGTNMLTLGVSNGFTGVITVQQGILQTTNGSALGATNGGTLIVSGATLDVSGQILGAEPVTVSGSGFGNGGAIINTGGAQQNALQRVTLTDNTTFGGSPRTSRWDIRGTPDTASLTGGYHLSKVGPTTVGLVNITVDPSLADVDIYDGMIQFEGSTTSLGDPAKTLTIHTNAAFAFYNATNKLNKQIVLNGGSLMVSNGANNTVVGPVTLNGGSLTNTVDTLFGSLTLNGAISGATLTKISGNTLTLGADNAGWSGGLTISGGTLQVGANTTTGALGTGPVTNNGSLAFNRSDAAGAYAGVISGTGNVVQQGSGTYTLSGLNTYAGTTTLSNGNLKVTANNVLPATTVLQFAGTNGTFDLGNTTQTISNLVTFSVFKTSVTNAVVGSGTLNVVSANDTYLGPNSGTALGVVTNTLNLAGLAAFNYTAPANVLRFGPSVILTNPAVSTVTLAATNTVTALRVGIHENTMNGSLTATNYVHLGQVNTINTDTLNVGSSRHANSMVDFATNWTAPSLLLRGKSGGSSGVTNVLIGSQNNNGFTTVNSVWDLTAGSVDAIIGLLTIGQTTDRIGTNSGYVLMNAGAMNITNLILGQTVSAATVGTTNTANGTFTLGGGTVTAGTIVLADNTATNCTSSGTVVLTNNGLLQVKSITKGRAATTSTNNGSITLNGTSAVLDLQGGAIGTNGVPATYVYGLNFMAGTLQNITEINGGTTNLVKTGTGALTIKGNNTYTGGTLVNAGLLCLGGDNVLGSNSVILAGGGLASDGTLGRTLTNNVTVSNNITLGDSIKTGSLIFRGLVDFTPTARNLTNYSEVSLQGVVSNNLVTKMGYGDLRFDGATGDVTGNVQIQQGAVVVSGGSLTKSAGGIRILATDPSGLARFVISNGATMTFTGSGQNIRVGSSTPNGNPTATNIMDVSATLVFTPDTTAGNVLIGDNSAQAVVNLLPGGLLSVAGFTPAAANSLTEINFNGGMLRASTNTTTFLQGLTNAYVRSAGAVIDTTNYNITIAQNLLDGTGGGGLTKLGRGALTLSGTNSYTGGTVVSNGTLFLNGVNAGGGAITISSNGILAGMGSHGGPVTVSGTLDSGPANAVFGTLTVGSTVFNPGSTNLMHLGTTTAIGGGANDLLVVNGDLTFSNGVIVDLSFAGTPVLDQPYTLINYTGNLSGDLTNGVTVTGVAASNPHLKVVLANVPGSPAAITVTLSITSAGANNLVWQGDGVTNQWMTLGYTNQWLNAAGWTAFAPYDSVLFNDTAANFTVTLTNALLPSAVSVNAANNYLFAGNGSIAGNASLTKSGAGSLTLATTNTYTGGTTINPSSGTLIASVSSAHNTLGSGPVSIGANSTLIISNTTTATTTLITNTISGSGLFKLNFAAGVTARNTYLTNAGISVLNGFTGMIELTNAGLTADKWTTGVGGAIPANLVRIGNGCQLFLGGVTNTFNAITVLGVGNTEGRGAIRVSGAGLLVGPISVLGDTSIGMEATTAMISGPITNGTSGSVTLTDGTASSPGAGIFSGVLGDGSAGGTLALTKASSGVLTLSAANTYSGNTLITGGKLVLGASASISNSPLILVSSGATNDVSQVSGGFILNGAKNQTLAGSGIVTGSVTAVSGTTIIPGTTGVVGTLSFSNHLTLEAGSTLVFDFAGVTNAANNDLIQMAGGNLTVNGAITVQGNLLNSKLTNASYVLLKGAGAILGGTTSVNDSRFVAAASLTNFTHGSITFDTATVAGSVLMVVGGANQTLVWLGDSESPWPWDVFNTKNWTNPATVQTDVFGQGDAVIFDDTGLSGTVGVATTLLPASVTFSNSTVNYTLGGAGKISGATALTKQGTGAVTLNVVSDYTGATTLKQGLVQLSSAGALTAGPLTLGDGTTANAATLDLSQGLPNQSFTALTVSTTNEVNPDYLKLGSGQTLTINGNVLIGPATTVITTNASTRLVVSGPGSLVVNKASGSIQVGNTLGGNNNGVKATMDLSGLTNFSVLPGLTTLQVGVGDNVGTSPSSLILAATNTITVTNLNIGPTTLGAVHSLKLGSGTNILNSDTINLGTGGRDVGTLVFNGTSGSVRIRNTAGTNRANLNVSAASGSNGGTGYGASDNVDLTGHYADVLIGTLNMGNYGRGGAGNRFFSFNQGILDIQSINMAADRAGGANNSTITFGGGTVLLGNAGLGSVVVATKASGTLIVTGGVVTASVDLLKGAAAGGTNVGTLTLDGGTLDMQGRNIGGAIPMDVLNLQSGTLQNVAEINAGSNVVKSGTGLLTLAGTNTYSGATVVSNGTLLVQGIINTNLVTVWGGTLGGNGLVKGAVTIQSGGTLAPGASFGVLTISNTVALNGNTVMEVGRIGTTPTNDQLTGVSTLTLGGTLTVQITSNAPAAGDVFKLFNASTLAGTFATYNLATLPAGLGWDTSDLRAGGAGNLVIVTLPVITQDPQPSVVISSVGSNVTFTAAATGPNLHYQWYFNVNTPIVGANTNVLSLTNLQSSHSGVYSFIVTNNGGAATSAMATLVVNSSTGPFNVNITPSPTNAVQVTNAAIFTVSASGTAPLYYLWYKNSNFAAVVSTTIGVTNSAVTCANDNDYYNVIVSNAQGTASAGPVYVRVTDSNAPAFSPAILTTNLTLMKGTNYSLPAIGLAANCNLATYRWYLNTTNLLAGHTTATLSLTDVKLNDAGTYTLIVSNKNGLSAIGTAAVVTVEYLVENPAVTVDGTTFQTTVTAEMGRAYWLEARDSLTAGSWTFVLGVTNVTGPQVLQDAAAAGPYKFYRIGSARVP